MGQAHISALNATGASNSPFVNAPPPTQGGSPSAAIAQRFFTPEAPVTTGGDTYARQVLSTTPAPTSPYQADAGAAALVALRNKLPGGSTPTTNPSAVAARGDNATAAGFAGQVFSGGASTT